MALKFNPSWGARVGCFPATRNSLVSASDVVGYNLQPSTTPGDPYIEANPGSTSEQIARLWATDVSSELNVEDRKQLETQANTTKVQLEALKAEGKTTVGEFEIVKKEIDRSEGKLDAGVNMAWSKAQASIMNLGTLKTRAFTNLDMLMVYAPSPSTASKFCQQKIDAERISRGITDKIATINRNIAEKYTKYYEERDSWLATILALLETFMKIIESLIALIVEAFKVGFYALEWAKSHPKTSYAIAGVLALLILGLILRPYISIVSAFFRKK